MDTDYRSLTASYLKKNSLQSKKLDLILQRIDNYGSLLDIGCGTGEFIERLGPRPGKVIYGLETHPLAFQSCRERFSGADCVKILDKTVEELCRDDPEKFDYITILDVLEHNSPEGLRSILACSYYLLKENGILIVSTPGVLDKLIIAYHKLRKRPYKHVVGHSSYGWATEIREANFRVIEDRTVEFPVVDSRLLNENLHLFGKENVIVAQK